MGVMEFDIHLFINEYTPGAAYTVRYAFLVIPMVSINSDTL